MGLNELKTHKKSKIPFFSVSVWVSMQISDQKSENNYYVDKATFQRIAQERKNPITTVAVFRRCNFINFIHNFSYLVSNLHKNRC